MFQISSWPRAILHLDGNAFFASVMQAAYPRYQNKPVVVGAERGIATAISYEAKAYGVKRGMRGFEIKKLCPKVIFLEGDYTLFSLYSQQMFTIMRRYSPIVEEYSIDEGFVDLTGMRRPLGLTYSEIARKMQLEVQNELGLPVSIGVSLSKSLAKLASGFRKPRGITLIKGGHIEQFLKLVPLKDIWGVGAATTSYLQKFGLKTAFDLASTPFLSEKNAFDLNKNHLEIIRELKGEMMYALNPNAKEEYKSMSKVKTFTPPSMDKEFLWASLMQNLEEVFCKARQYNYSVLRFVIFLKTQKFRFHSQEVRLSEGEKYPMLLKSKLREVFENLYKVGTLYRATGCVLSKLKSPSPEQASLFKLSDENKMNKVEKLYVALQGRAKIDFGTSLYLEKGGKHGETLSSLPKLKLGFVTI